MSLPADPDPVARLIRKRRAGLGLSLHALAAAASAALPKRARGRRGTSVSSAYLSLIENGRKVPDEAVAVAIAAAIGEDPALLRAWVSARKRSALGTALEAAEVLRAFAAAGAVPAGSAQAARASASDADTALEIVRAPAASGRIAPLVATAFARLRVPVIAAGDDPGDAVRPQCTVVEWRALHTDRLSAEARARLDRPFAIRLADEAASVGLAPGDHALVLRDLAGLPPESVCAVRVAGRVALRRVTWDGRRALLLPAGPLPGFEIVEVPSVAALSERVIGIARRVAFGE